MHEAYDKLIALLEANKASYRLIDHVPEGQTDKVSAGQPGRSRREMYRVDVRPGRRTGLYLR